MKKTIATLLVICMMFSIVPVDLMAPVFQDIYASTMGNSTIITSSESQAGKGGGEVGRAYRITLSRDPKTFLQENKTVKDDFMRNFSYEYPPFGRGTDGKENTMYLVKNSTLSGIWWSFEKDTTAIARYTNTVNKGMDYYTGSDISALVAGYDRKTSRPFAQYSNPFKEAVLAARDAKTITSTTELATNMAWKTYAQKMDIDQCRALLGYVLNENDNMKARIKDVIDKNWEKDVSQLTADEAFEVNAGYGGFLVAMWKLALLRGADGVAASYEQAITDYFKNNDLKQKPVTILIDTCMIYSVKEKKGVNYAIAPAVELYEYVIATDMDNSILNGPEFITMETGRTTTRGMIMAMAQSSFDRYPFETTKGWATGSNKSSEKQVYRLIDKPYDGDWNEVTLQTTAVGWAIKVFQLKGTQSHMWMKPGGPKWYNDNDKQGLMDHLGIDLGTGMSLDGFMAIGNAISTPSLEIRYKVSDDAQSTQDICDPVVTLDNSAHISMSIGANADFLSYLEALKESEGGGSVQIISSVTRTELLDGAVVEVLEAPFPADGTTTAGGPAGQVQSAINWKGTIQDFIDRGVTTVDVFDDSIKGKTYEKKKDGNQTVSFQYDIGLKVIINKQTWEFEWTDIVERSGTVPLNTLTLPLQPLDENMGCFTEDVEIIDIPGTYGTDTTQTEVLPSDNEDPTYYTRMMNRYEYTSSVGKSVAANAGEMVDKWQVTGVNDVADGDVSAFAELKSNTPLNEEWEVMAGIPSSEEIYFSVGGAEYKVALIVQYWMNEHNRDRTYTIHFDGEKCEYNNEGEGTGDRLREWFPEAQPDPAIGGGHYNDVSIHCLNEPGSGAGDWQIQATWTYYSTNHEPIKTPCAICGGADINRYCVFTGATEEYNKDLEAANKLADELAAEIVYWTAASDGIYREYYWDVSVDPGSAPSDGTGVGNDGSAGCKGDHTKCGTHCGGHGSGSKAYTDSCGNACWEGAAHDPGSPCPGHGWTIKVTATIPAHAVCGPCCGHNMPDLYDTWRQGLVYDYAKISQIRLYILDEGSVEGLTELTGTDRLIANVVTGNPTYFMNMAQMTEQDANPYYPKGAPEGLSGTNQANTWYGSAGGIYNGIYGDWNRYEAQSSRAGRIRYVLDPAYSREESFPYSEQGDGSGGTFSLTMAQVANPKQHDDVIVEMGKRSANCDGMSNHDEFGKSSSNNVEPDTAYGHADSHPWADGCLYTHIINDANTNFANYHRLNSYGYSYVAQELKANDKNVANYSELYNHHVQRDGLTNKSSYSDSADDRDIATAEWKVFNAARRTKVIAVVISDFLIMQTSGGDQSIFYFEKAAKTAEAQEHFQKVKATETEMFTENPLSVFNGQDCEEPCTEKDGSALIKSGIQGFEIVGGYNGRYDRPADKYKPYSPVTKEFLRFGGTDGNNWTQYNASYNRANWTEKVGGDYSPHGNYKVYTIFDDDPAGTFNRPKRLATSQAESFKIYQDNIQILPTAPNQFYQPTNAMIWYSQVVGCFSPDNNALDMERMSMYVGARSNVNLGWLQRNKFGTEWLATWGTSVGLELNTKYYLTGDGDSNTDSINGVLVYTPVSVEDAIVLPQGDLTMNGFTVSRDQRVDDWKYPNMNDVVNALKVCTLDPATCEYRYLDCKYLHETVLADFDFSSTYQGTEPDYSGDYVHNLKPVTKKNTYQEDGKWITTNKITGIEYELPTGYTIQSSGFGNGNYLAATGSTAWSIPFSDLGLSNTKSNRVKISMDLKVNSSTKDTMIAGFRNVGFIITPSYKGQFIRPYDDNPNLIGSTKSFTNNMQSVKLDLIFSFSNIVDCEAYVNGVAATVEAVTDYRFDWQTGVNAQGFEIREKVLKYVTIPKDEWLSNPPPNFTTNDIMGTLNIGTWGNTNSTYNTNANFYVDNLTITLMGGTTEHTSACYERTTIHTSTLVHVCDDNCYLKEDVYTCDGEPNANYQCNGVNNKHEHTNACYTNVTSTSVTVAQNNSMTKEYVAKTAGTITLAGYGSCSAETWIATLTVNGTQVWSWNDDSPGNKSYTYKKDDVVKFYVYSYDSCSVGWTVSWTNGSFGEMTGTCTGALNTHVHTGTAGLDYANGCYTVPSEHKHNVSTKILNCTNPVLNSGGTPRTIYLYRHSSGCTYSGSDHYSTSSSGCSCDHASCVSSHSGSQTLAAGYVVWLHSNAESMHISSTSDKCSVCGKTSGSVTIKSNYTTHTHTDACYKAHNVVCDKMPAGTYVCTGIKNTMTDLNAHKHTVACFLIENYVELEPTTFQYTGGVQTFKVPYSDFYKVEIYGPGANSKSGYASAIVKLNQDDLLYVYVGGTNGYHNYMTDIRFNRYTDIPTGITEFEREILEKNNAASDATIMMKAGRTLATVATYNLTDYALTSVTKSLVGNSTNGRVIFTPLNQLPHDKNGPTILEQILNGDITEEDAHKYLGDELADLIIKKTEVFKTYEDFSWKNNQGVLPATPSSEAVSFANGAVVSQITTTGGDEFYIPVDIQAKSVRQVRITVNNYSDSTSFRIHGGSVALQASEPMKAQASNQTIVINVSQAWWNNNISGIWFDPSPGTGQTGRVEVTKIELLGHANVINDQDSSYAHADLLTVKNFTSTDTKGFANIQNTAITFSNNKMVVTANGNDPQTVWNGVGTLATGAIKAIKIVFTNKSTSTSTGQLFYKDATNSFNEDDSFAWYVGGSGSGTQTVWIDTVNHTSYNETTKTFTRKGTGWSGNVTAMRFDWTSLSSGGIEISEITFIGRGTSSINYTFDYLGKAQSVKLPNGSWQVDLWGAQGGDGRVGNTETLIESGGKGGYTEGQISANGNTTYYVYVGGKGGAASSGTKTFGAGGWNGGGNGGTESRGENQPENGAGGGGMTHITTSSTDKFTSTTTTTNSTGTNTVVDVAAGTVVFNQATPGTYSVTLKPGTYKLEAWGAQGGSYSSLDNGGYGGYSVGTYTITTQTTLYIGVGGQGGSYSAGFNGGGYAKLGGGGASHIALSSKTGGGTQAPGSIAEGSFSSSTPYCWYQTASGCTYEGYYSYSSSSTSYSYHCSGWVRKPEYDYGAAQGTLAALVNNKSDVLLVAGGGGGAGNDSGSGQSASGAGGQGGGTNASGTNGIAQCGAIGYGGTLSAGGAGGSRSGSYYAETGSFGQGGAGYTASYTSNGSGGGGGGYYGGGGSIGDLPNFNDYDDSGAGGGSGYANTSKLTAGTGQTGVRQGNGEVKITTVNDITTTTTVTTGTTTVTETVSFDTSKVIMVAGGGGGGSGSTGASSTAGDVTWGGDGGGTSGVSTNSNTTAGTQSSGYSKRGMGGPGWSYNYSGGTDLNYGSSGGGGGGWYGGYTSSGLTTTGTRGGAGGSGYIGSGVTGGTTTAGQRTGNGYATIKSVSLTGTIQFNSTSEAKGVWSVTAGSYTHSKFKATYNNPFENETTVRQTIYNNLDLIPDYVDGIYNPIWVCKFDKFNFHDCKNCNTYVELDCNEPHHKGLSYDNEGNLMLDNYGKPLCKEHYAGSNKICWSACGIDSNHKNTKDEVIVDNGGGTEVLKLAEYLQLDEGFTIYFPNIGDFYGNNALGLANPQITRGFGYTNRMDTTRWTREKRVKFPFDVIFEEANGEQYIYPANTWIELDVPTEYFNFYLLVENQEMSNASVEFECEAINCGTTTGIKPKGGLAYSNMVGTAYTDALNNFLENYLNQWYADILDEGYEIPHAKPKGANNNEGANKRIAFDSWGIMDFWKTKQENEAVVLRNTVDSIDRQIEVDFEGAFNDYMIDHTGRGMNEELKPITSNDNKVRVNNAMRSDSLRHLHGAYKKFYIDVIGRIGNFAIVDTEDFRFSNFFKVPIINNNDTEGLNDPNNWLVEGLILKVDDSVQNFYLGDTFDIRGSKAQVNTRWLDTYGTESWMTGTLTGGGRNINNPNLKSQILTGEVNNIDILKQEQLRYGYDIYTSIVTFGSYDNGQIQVVPKYYALKVTDRNLENVPAEYNVAKGTYVPLDVYSNEDGTYSPVNIFNNAGNGNPNISNIPMFDYTFNLDWTEESNRRNYTLEEIARTNRVREYYKTVLYDLSGIEEGADYNPEDLPILDIVEYTVPNGRTNYLGTCQYILMGAEHRTFIGSPNSYDNNAGGNAIWTSRAGTTNFGVDKGNFENAYNIGGGRAIEDIYFERAVQRWHGKLGLPSSSVFVPHGQEVTIDSMEWIQGENEEDWVIVCTAEIIAVGTVWNIHYSQPWFTKMTIYGDTYSTGAHYPGHRVENANGDSVPCSQCLPPIIAVFGKTSVDDVEIVQIY